MMKKLLKDFTLKEAVNRALGAFGQQDTEEHAKHEDERRALHTVVEFKIAENQDKINIKLLKLTRWLVILTILLVVLTIILVLPAIINLIKNLISVRS